MGVVAEGDVLVIAYFLPIEFDVFLDDILQVDLLDYLLLIGGEQIIKEGAGSVDDVFIFLEDGIGDGADGDSDFGGGIGSDIDESQ
jgi:hypothetical protein